jgi:hypothetical protein
MRRRIVIRLTILVIFVLAAFLFLYSSPGKNQPASKESIEECCQKKCKAQDNDLMLEPFSRQLISLSD